MKTIQLTFLFEDTGFCKDVFQSVNQPYYYCNRDTVDGTWYTSTPDDYQNDCRIRKDVIIEIISDGQVIAGWKRGLRGEKAIHPLLHL